MRHLIRILALVSTFAACQLAQALVWPSLSEGDRTEIAARIYQNECASDPEKLIYWGDGEDFPSLGIGHFIWFPRGVEPPFNESFPAMIEHLQKQGVKVPAILLEADSPWSSPVALAKAKDKGELEGIRVFLLETQQAQLAFILDKAREQLEPFQSMPEYEKKLQQVLDAPGGVYAVVDYLNFKGSGLDSNERYNGQGWGLKQVLDRMPDEPADPLDAFAEAAKQTLTVRTKLAPDGRDESRWLPGWYKRLDTYLVNDAQLK